MSRPDSQAPGELEPLIEACQLAMERQDYARAVNLLRMAVRRAPFRSGLRQMLSQAIEGQTASGEPSAEPSVEAAPPRSPREAARQAVLASGKTAWDPDKPPTFTGHPPLDAAPASRAFKPHPERNFTRRHNRGPLSAWLGMALGGVILLGAAGAGLWLYYKAKVSVDGEEGFTRAEARRIQAAREMADRYLDQGEYAMAIEQIARLPKTPLRERWLAEIKITQGNLCLKAEPRNLQGAREAYIAALEHDEYNAEAGNALGQVNYLIGRSREQAAQAHESYLESEQAYEAVLARHPDDANALNALNGLAQTSIQLNKQNAALECWRRVIRLAPESPQAAAARRSLDNLGWNANE